MDSQLAAHSNQDIFTENHTYPDISVPNQDGAEPPSSILSHKKSQAIVELIRGKSASIENSPYAQDFKVLFEGDPSQETNMTSLKMMQSHIDSYWKNFHSQLPICRFWCLSLLSSSCSCFEQ